MKNKTQSIIIKFMYILLAILFAIPSIVYLIKNKTIHKFSYYFAFLLNDTNKSIQTIIYLSLLISIIFIYWLIIKNREKLFKNMKRIYLYILILSSVFLAVLPFTSSDVFYYLGVGRIDSKYGQNPYYTTIKEFVDKEENVNFERDTVLMEAYQNVWSDTTVVYGPVWQLVCKVVAGLSFGNIDLAIFIFKILQLLLHLLNCYLIYKISGKKIFVLLYGLNPFVLIEGIANMHNDMYVVSFLLASLYFLIKKKSIVKAICFLVLATAIKYFSILLLPFMVFYHVKDKKISQKVIDCIKYGALFFFLLILTYLAYVKDFHVLAGLLTQQEKIAKGIYVIIYQYFTNIPKLTTIIHNLLLIGFIIIYFFICIKFLMKKEIKFRDEMRAYYLFLLAFLFLLITNFQPWYVMWLFPCMLWQKAKDIKFIIQISQITQLANSVFLAYNEGWRYGVPFFIIMLGGALIVTNLNQRKIGGKSFE